MNRGDRGNPFTTKGHEAHEVKSKKQRLDYFPSKLRVLRVLRGVSFSRFLTPHASRLMPFFVPYNLRVLWNNLLFLSVIYEISV